MAAVSASADKQRVALRSIFGAVFVTALKLVIGLTTGSLGILSEAAHSALDLLAAALTYMAVRVSEKPADRDHLYGHQKVENFSAFLEIGLLLATCFWIIYEAGRRLLGGGGHVEATPAAFAVMAASVVVDYLRSRELRAAARRYHSQALEADALHFSTDIWASAVVIAGLAAVRLGDYYQRPELQKADPIAALGVAAITLLVSVRLGRSALQALLDAAPAGLADRIEQRLTRVDGVLAVDQVRARQAGNQHFVDAKIAVDRRAPLAHAKNVADDAQAAIQDLLPGSDVIIHTEPRGSGFETLFDLVKLVAARRNLAVHELTAYDTPSGVSLEFHLELDDRLSLEAAHRMVDELEAEIQREAPQVVAITTHIENEGAQIRRSALTAEDAARWRAPLIAVARQFPEVMDCHEITVHGSNDHPSISCHCVFAGDMTVARVHEITSEIESRFRQRYPQVDRVTIHPEPHTVLAQRDAGTRPVA